VFALLHGTRKATKAAHPTSFPALLTLWVGKPQVERFDIRGDGCSLTVEPGLGNGQTFSSLTGQNQWRTSVTVTPIFLSPKALTKATSTSGPTWCRRALPSPRNRSSCIARAATEASALWAVHFFADCGLSKQKAIQCAHESGLANPAFVQLVLNYTPIREGIRMGGALHQGLNRFLLDDIRPTDFRRLATGELRLGSC